MNATARTPLYVAIAFASLLALASGLAPVPPGVGRSGTNVVRWGVDHAGAIRWQAWTVMLSTLPGGALLALVHRRMTGVEATVFLIGGITTVGILVGALLLRLGLARAAVSGTDASVARALADVEAYWAPLLTFPVILQALALTVASRRGSFPLWLAPVSLVLVAEQTIETGSIFGHGGAFAPGGDLNTTVGPALYLVWLIAQGYAAGRPMPKAAGAVALAHG